MCDEGAPVSVCLCELEEERCICVQMECRCRRAAASADVRGLCKADRVGQRVWERGMMTSSHLSSAHC